MPRLRRLLTTGKVFFVTTNLQRRLRQLNQQERNVLCETLDTIRLRYRFRLAGFAIMPDHAHFLLLPHSEDSLSKIIKEWKRASSIRINRLRGRKGQLWQKGFFDHYMRTPQELLETLEYIHWNPVRKELAKTPTNWPWSSAAAYAGKHCLAAVDFLDLPAETEKHFS